MASTPNFPANGIRFRSAFQTTVNTSVDGTTLAAGNKVGVISNANGATITKIRFTALGTNVATAVRIWLVQSDTPGTATNNELYRQFALPATTASATAAVQDFDIVINEDLPNGYGIYVALQTAVAGGWQASTVGFNK
jgi:hypothetical protein